MNLPLLVSLLLIYFPLLYYYKTRITRITAGADKPEFIGWYEEADYVIRHTVDQSQRNELLRWHKQLRTVSFAGIILFWLIVFFYP